ncbi:MAG: TonB-dependent receptor, partial [Desulfuromusa sp.]|nr:TonB-dependent receptor [Desulfuromusa sp.]
AKQQPLVIDLLRSVPGVYITRSGGPGEPTSISIRGTDNKHTLVMIDGVEQSDPSSIGAAANLTDLSTINIERIEVVRGAQSVLYGSDAIGGVINIITKKGEKQPTGYVSIEGGSFNTWIGKGGFSVAKEGGHLSFSASNSSSDSFSSANENNGNTEDDGYKNTSFSLNGGARPSDLFEINLSANYSDAEYDMDGFAWGIGPVDADETAFTNTFSGHVEGVFHLLQDRWQLQVGSSLTKIDRDYPDSPWAKAFNGKKTKLELVNRFALNSQHTLVFGAETETETAETDSGVDEDATTNAFYLQDEFIAGAFNATVGLRQDRHDDFGSETTWRFSSGYSLAATGTRLKGSVGTGFKAPSLYQLFDSYSGNQNLKAETSLGYDIGIEQGLLDNSLILQVTWFHNDIDDYIEWVGNGWSGMYQNAGDIITQGVETSLELYPAEFVDLRLNYTYTDSEDKGGSRLLRRPLHTGNFDLNFHFLEDKMVNLNILYVGERDDSSET